MHWLLPPKLVLFLIIVMVSIGLLVPIVEAPVGAWRLIGILPLAFGLGLVLNGGRLFDQIDTNIKTFGEPDALVSSGPFRWTRNPMYLGFVLLLVGVAILVGGITGWIGPVVFFVAADRWYIPFEETRMIETFGVDYEAYRGKVSRWLGPRLQAEPS